MLNLVVDTYRDTFKYELNEFAKPDKFKWLASMLEGSLKDLMEAIYNEQRKEYAELKEYIEKYLSKSENYEKYMEENLKNNLKKRVLLQIKGEIYANKISYDYSEAEDLAIALMLMLANIYNQLTKIDGIKARNFKEWAIEEVGITLGSSFWHTLEICILD